MTRNTTPPSAHRRSSTTTTPARQQPNPAPDQALVRRDGDEPLSPAAVLNKQLRSASGAIQTMLGGDGRTSAAFLAQVFTLIKNNPKLMKADRGSLLLAVGEMASLGMSPNPKQGQAYLIPRWSSKAGCDVVDMQLGFRGLLQLVYRSGEVDSVEAFVVYRGEHYVRRGGTANPGIDHLLDDDKRTGLWTDIVGAYALAFLKGRTRPVFVSLTRRQLESAYGRSGNGSNKSKVWMEHPEAMCAKTALARLCKNLPQVGSTTLAIEQLAREADRELDGGLVYASGARKVMAAAQPMGGLDGLVARGGEQDDEFDYGRVLHREGGDQPAEQGEPDTDGAAEQDPDADEFARGAEAFDQIEDGSP